MADFLIKGGHKLHGEITVQGAKNSVLPLLAATYLSDSECVLHNCPRLSDVKASVDILEHLGCKCRFEGNTLTVNSKGCYSCEIPENLMREMRSSIIFLGAIAAKCKNAEMSLPGGCELGPRPIDMHLDALRQLGANIECVGGKVVCVMADGVKGADIHLRFPSVGATENIILASVLAEGTTTVYNAAKEPEIEDLSSFLNKCGAKISGAGTSTVRIEGVKSLHGTEHRVLPDRIVAATFLYATAMNRGKLKLCGANFEHLVPFTSQLLKSGCDIKFDNDSVTVKALKKLHNFDVITSGPYPSFPTDAGPSLVAASALMSGTGVFVENIFDSRFRYVDELKKLGADIKVFGRTAIITGVGKLQGAEVNVHDLRGGAALTTAALSAEGESVVKCVEYIDRGYENIEDTLCSLGAEVKRI